MPENQEMLRQALLTDLAAFRENLDRFPLFRRMKQYYLYRHSAREIDKGYDITTRFCDGVFDTRFPEAVRRSLGKD